MSPQPFDKEKYQRLMDGLECSEVLYSYIMNHSDILRWDSFYYSQEFLNDEHILQSHKYYELKELENTSILSFGAYSLNNFVEYTDVGIPFIRCVDMRNGLIDTEGLTHISESAHTLLYKSEVFPETILLSMSGSIGNVALSLPEWKYPINSNQDIAKIRLYEDMNPYYVYSFLRTKYGQNFMRREARGSVQQHVFISQIEQIKIPLFSSNMYKRIEQITKGGFSCVEKAKDIYHQAESLLLSSLSLDTFTPSINNTSVKTFSQIAERGRMDAEYYQKKYDDIEERIKLNDYITAFDVISPNNKNFTPLMKENYIYIELANVESYGSINDSCTVANGADLPTRARRRVKTGDVIISSIEGSLESCALIPEKYNHALCSTGFYIMHSNEINAETLLLLFKSHPIKTLMKRGCSGTILSAISVDELKRVPIPVPDKSTQQEIVTKIRKSFALRGQSKSLLKAAVRAVEIAIEQDESAAIAYLKKQTEGDA